MQTREVLSVSLPPGFRKKDLELIAKVEGRTKSELVREALRRYLEGWRLKEFTAYARAKAKVEGKRYTEQDFVKMVRADRRAQSKKSKTA